MSISTHHTRLLGTLAALALLAAGCGDQAPLDPEGTHPLAAAGGANVVQVDPPTGMVEEDRASILAALEEVRPGGTVQFAPGTYLIGIDVPLSRDPIRVTVPHITLRGHPDGTTLRGCDPGVILPSNCLGLELSGGHQAVRDLSFEDLTAGVILGRWPFPVPIETRVGGYRIEDNEFRNSIYGVRMFGQWEQPALVRSNTFVNTAWTVEAWGRTVHVMDNDISAPDWEQIPFFFAPLDAITFGSLLVYQTGTCDHNVAARNRVEGHWSGVLLAVNNPAVSCRHNVIRDNTIIDAHGHEVLGGLPGAGVWVENNTGDPGILAHTLVQGNTIHGVEGVGVLVYDAAQFRVVNNTVTDVAFSPFDPPWFVEANGSGVWLLLGEHNHILNNRFSEVASFEILLESDYSHVSTRSASDVVRDLGVGNRISGPGSVVTASAPVGASVLGAPRVMERAEAERRLRERTGARGLLLGRNAVLEAAPR
jgi:hypothetical protein